MGKDAGEWVPKKGERARFRVARFTEVHSSVPCEGEGTVVRDIRYKRAERCDYEVEVEGHGRLCFFQAELRPCWWHDDH